MTDMRAALREIASLEQMADQNSWIRRRSSLAKVVVTLVFVVTVISFPPLQVGRLMPYVFYPAVMGALTGIPLGLLLKRTAVALPFVLMAGLSNLLFDRAPVSILGSWVVTQGMLSGLSLLVRTLLCVAAVLQLVAVTPLWELADGLRRLRVPDILVVTLEMTYRYIATLLEEAASMSTAYHLRSPGSRGLAMKHMGSFAGQLLIRSYDRAERVYQAMKCRLYQPDRLYGRPAPFTRADGLYLLCVCLPCLALRLADVTALWRALAEAFA